MKKTQTNIPGKTYGEMIDNLASHLLKTQPFVADFILTSALEKVCETSGIVSIDDDPASSLYHKTETYKKADEELQQFIREFNEEKLKKVAVAEAQ